MAPFSGLGAPLSRIPSVSIFGQLPTDDLNDSPQMLSTEQHIESGEPSVDPRTFHCSQPLSRAICIPGSVGDYHRPVSSEGASQSPDLHRESPVQVRFTGDNSPDHSTPAGISMAMMSPGRDSRKSASESPVDSPYPPRTRSRSVSNDSDGGYVN
jgi:hypothetical protein